MRLKKNHIYVGIISIAVILGAVFYLLPIIKQAQIKEAQTAEKAPVKEEDKNPSQVDKNGYLSYPLDRGDVKFRREDYGADGDLTIHKIAYQSKYGNVYGLLVLPTTAPELLPGVVLLPGAGVSKESELGLARKIALLDAAVLVIDQRGVGETGGIVPSLDDDYSSFIAGREPLQHLMVYDALRAYDLMKNAPFTDSDRIMIAGESLGGRIAIIAAAIDRNIKGVLAISSAGFDFKGGPDEDKNRFLKSIDADNYIELITPRKIVMMHNSNDRNVPITSAVNTYSRAQEPKQFALVNDTSCNHGYCDSMYDALVESLDYIIDIKSKTLVSVPAR
ncbi:alpha/beta hydrolase [Candidatus Woesearchaeota archaeon]|nr:alpha/beta hydrolase [Candidatus Woesearchaeota archaeon]